MSLDPKYIPLDYLETYLVNKDDGLPLSSGKIYFYSDVNRSLLKNVYTITGNAPNYSYVALPNPSTLSGVGTFQDAGQNNVVPYVYPYDSEGNSENYYIEVYSSGNVLQFTREAVPNVSSESVSTSDQNLINYIPNGQFLLHNNLPADITNNYKSGQIRQDSTPLAMGGCYFERSSTSTATDYVTFSRYGSFVTNPDASPRYAVNVQCLGADTNDTTKNLSWRFNDSNKFSSDTQKYTFSFNASTLDTSSDFEVKLYIIKFFGITNIYSIQELKTFNITSTATIFQHSFVFGSNAGEPLSSTDNDYVEVSLLLPTNLTFGGSFTDFILTPDEVNITGFPQTTNADFVVRSSTTVPNDPDGYTLYLSKVDTLSGAVYDDSMIGKVFACYDPYTSSISSTTNEMLCDGSAYYTYGYSNLGIPFARLHKKIFNINRALPLFGTGRNFVTLQSTSNRIEFFSNSSGSTIIPTDVSTGFQFINACPSALAPYGYRVYRSNESIITFVGKGTNSISGNPVTSGNTGFTYFEVLSNTYREVFNIGNAVVTSTLAGKYFTYKDLTNAENYVWFRVDGVGSDPAPGGTGIKIELQSYFNTTEVILAVACAVNGCFYSTIVISGTPAAGSCFTFTVNSGQKYYVYYIVNGVGTDPAITNAIGISVSINSSDSTSSIASATRYAVNSTYFATPDLRGLILRGNDPTGIWDLDYADRFGESLMQNDDDNAGNPYGLLGTMELDNILSHDHTFSELNSGVGSIPCVSPALATTTKSVTVSTTGIYENRMVNAAVNWVMKY